MFKYLFIDLIITNMFVLVNADFESELSNHFLFYQLVFRLIVAMLQPFRTTLTIQNDQRHSDSYLHQ